jgi:hypothetical protein
MPGKKEKKKKKKKKDWDLCALSNHPARRTLNAPPTTG